MNQIKVLDKGFVSLFDKMGYDATVPNAARVSNGIVRHDTEFTERDRRLTTFLMNARHTSPFEMCEISFVIKVPIFVRTQMFRHRTASVNEHSGRYSEIQNEFYIPNTLHTQHNKNKQMSSDEIVEQSAQLIAEMTKQCEEAFELYNKLIKSGVSREMARIILPQNTYTTFIFKMDLHNLINNFFRLRCAEDVQPETREVANAMKEITKTVFPNIMEIYEMNK